MENTLFESFHFLRPWWLLAIVPAIWLVYAGQRRRLDQRQWHNVIDPVLLDHMVEQAPDSRKTPKLRWLGIGWLLACLALAGPSWQKLPQPVFKNDDALVILLDMSYSMAAEDVKPSRAERAIQKVHDILNTRRDGLTALITYAGDAHTVTPLTDDNSTIANLLPAISPFIMPAPGSRPDKAIELAQQLVHRAGLQQAHLLLITDGIQPRDVGRIQQQLDSPAFSLGVIALGSQQGAPIPLPKGGFLQDGSGAIVMAGLDPQPLNELQSQSGIRWQPISLLDNDWQSLISSVAVTEQDRKSIEQQLKRQFDSWLDEGFWLLIALLPLALLAFRKGTFMASLLLTAVLIGSLQPGTAFAAEETAAEASMWENLWATPDQQGARLLDSDPAAAARRFEDPSWAGTAAYQAGDYASAASAFAQDNSADGHYNRGNALAQQGELQQALDAYDQALALDPDMEDARKNRDLVAQALKQQNQQQQQDNQQNQNDSDNSDQQQQQQNQNSQSSDQQNQQQNQQGSQQQDSNQQSQQQSDSESSDQQQADQQQSDSQQANQQQSSQQKQSEQQADQDFRERLQQQQKQQAQKQDPDDSAPKDTKGQRNQSQDDSEQNQSMMQADSAQSDEDGSDDSSDVAQQSLPPLGEIPADSLKDMTPEQQAQLRQWLNRVPDQPGKLLERKFLYQYSQQQPQQNDPEEVLW